MHVRTNFVIVLLLFITVGATYYGTSYYLEKTQIDPLKKDYAAAKQSADTANNALLTEYRR